MSNGYAAGQSSRERSLERNSAKLDQLAEERIAEFGRSLAEDNVVINYEKRDEDPSKLREAHLDHCHDELKDILAVAERNKRAASGGS